MEMCENGSSKVGEKEDHLEICERKEKLEFLLIWYGYCMAAWLFN